MCNSFDLWSKLGSWISRVRSFRTAESTYIKRCPSTRTSQEWLVNCTWRMKAALQCTANPREDGEDQGPSFRIEGPTEFLEHGGIFKVAWEIPDWLPGWRRLTQEKKLSKAALRKSEIVSDIFDELAKDLAIEQVLGLKYDAKYLTNLPGEAPYVVEIQLAR